MERIEKTTDRLNERERNKIMKMANALLYGTFIWDKTTSGADCWSRVYKKLLNLSSEDNSPRVLPKPVKKVYKYIVPSFTTDGVYYTVLHVGSSWTCSCPHWINTIPRKNCKHIKFVRSE